MFWRSPFDNSFDQWGRTIPVILCIYVYIYIQISTATMMPTTTIKWLRCSCRRDRDFVLSQLHYFHINPRRRYICVASCATNLNESNKSAKRDASLNHAMPAFPLLIATIFFHFQTRHPGRHCYRWFCLFFLFFFPSQKYVYLSFLLFFFIFFIFFLPHWMTADACRFASKAAVLSIHI